MAIPMSAERFELLVADALDEIPEPFAAYLSNVHVLVEDEPTEEELQEAGVEEGGTLFGLYYGVPQTERGIDYSFAMPDRVTIFRGPILRACTSEDEVVEEVAVTVVHEIAHHFGISDERLAELGWD